VISLVAVGIVFVACLGSLLAIAGVVRIVFGPDLDLTETEPWAVGPMCRCGARGVQRHIHPGWTPRGPRS
jgi:hypothetical protein